MQEWRVSVLCSDWLQSVLLGKYRAAGARVCTSPHTQCSSHSLFVNSHYPHVEARTGNSECRKNVNTPRNIKTLKYSICSHVQGKGTTNLLVVFFYSHFFDSHGLFIQFNVQKFVFSLDIATFLNCPVYQICCVTLEGIFSHLPWAESFL